MAVSGCLLREGRRTMIIKARFFQYGIKLQGQWISPGKTGRTDGGALFPAFSRRSAIHNGNLFLTNLP